ncbi:MAG TPA: hypothetical protein VLJ68_08180, partial [Chitinophagaceae bacterium]|nr:hypothetical protein [Chitinophagaceae bacterium]
MKKNWVKISALVLAVALLVPAAIMAQDEKKDKEEKENKEKKVIETYTITRKNDSKEKVVIEINGDKVTVNGKPLEEYKDGDVTIRRNRIRERDGMTWTPGTGNNTYDWNNGNGNFNFFNEDENRAMLGVITEKAD